MGKVFFMKTKAHNRIIVLSLILTLTPLWTLSSHLQPADAGDSVTHDHSSSHNHGATEARWEGSPEGKVYSEFNHHLAGIFVIFIAFSEFQSAIRAAAAARARLLLPLSMLTAGLFLIIWSDHDAWPIGSITFTQTFLTGNWETVQHKWFGIFLLLIGGIELLRRSGKLEQKWVKFPLPMFAIVGGLSLFFHTHGDHPSIYKIAAHHAVMGIMAIAAGSSKLFTGWKTPPVASAGVRGPSTVSPWELAWAGLIFLIGIQLLMYRE